MSVTSRFQGWQTMFHIELLYGVLFVGGFAALVFRFDPRLAAFGGGLVVGYILRVWEKMSIYERVIEDAVSAEAEEQVRAEAEERVQAEVEDTVGAEVAEQVPEEVAERLDEAAEQSR